MSIQATSHVWEHSKQSGSNLLVLLALADFTNTEGVAWPSIETIAKKVRTSERNVQKIIRKLKDAGELVVEPGPTHWSTWRYKIAGLATTVRQGGELQYAPPGVLRATQNHQSFNPQEESDTELDLVDESSYISAEGHDDDGHSEEWEPDSDDLLPEIATGVNPKHLQGYLRRYGVVRMNAAYNRALEAKNIKNPIGYMISLLTSNSPLTPISAAPLPPASVAQSAYADWIDVGYGPGVFTAPEQPVTQGDTAADNTPALDDEQREYFRQVDAEDETTPDAEFTDMSDVIPDLMKALQK